MMSSCDKFWNGLTDTDTMGGEKIDKCQGTMTAPMGNLQAFCMGTHSELQLKAFHNS